VDSPCLEPSPARQEGNPRLGHPRWNRSSSCGEFRKQLPRATPPTEYESAIAFLLQGGFRMVYGLNRLAPLLENLKPTLSLGVDDWLR
jgi:hypothetical protein